MAGSAKVPRSQCDSRPSAPATPAPAPPPVRRANPGPLPRPARPPAPSALLTAPAARAGCGLRRRSPPTHHPIGPALAAPPSNPCCYWLGAGGARGAGPRRRGARPERAGLPPVGRVGLRPPSPWSCGQGGVQRVGTAARRPTCLVAETGRAGVPAAPAHPKPLGHSFIVDGQALGRFIHLSLVRLLEGRFAGRAGARSKGSVPGPSRPEAPGLSLPDSPTLPADRLCPCAQSLGPGWQPGWGQDSEACGS